LHSVQPGDDISDGKLLALPPALKSLTLTALAVHFGMLL
jgi:hypothetical protein